MCYEIRYVLEGECYLKYNGQNYILKKGEGCLIDCRKKYYYYHSSNYNCVSTCLRFNGSPADSLIQAYLLSGNVKFTNEKFSNFEPLQTHILQCTQKSSSYMEYEVSCTFYLLLTNILIAQSKTRSTSEDIEKIVSYIQANYMKNLTIENLSHIFGISRTHMTRCFKEYTGFAPHQYITQIRIYNAKYLLKTTNLSIDDISRQTGFSDSVYFIQVFKKMEGMTPSKFRKI